MKEASMSALKSMLILSTGICVLLCSGCSERPVNQDLYIYEELDTAAQQEDPVTRIERLKRFAANHGDHPARVNAFASIITTMAVEMNDLDGALDYFNRVMETERDPAARGELLYRKFEYLWDADRDRAVALAGEIIDGQESDYRLHLYLCYYLMGEDELAGQAERCFDKLLAIKIDPYRDAHARSVYGEFLSGRGRMDEALKILEGAGDYPFAGELLGSYRWENGDREKAMEAYIAYVAGVPGAGQKVKIDSLYSVVYPGRGDLEEKLASRRVVDEGVLPDMEFSDLHGKTHRLSSHRGKKLVISAWSPT